MKNEEAAVSVLICITILPSLLSVLLAFIGIKSLISLIAYTIGAFFLVRLKIRTSKKCGKGFWIVLLYLLLFIISVKYTISPKISEEKLENIVYNIFIPISLLLVLFRYKIDFSILETLFIKKIYRCSIFICIFLALLLMLGFTEKGEDIEGRDTIIGMRDAI